MTRLTLYRIAIKGISQHNIPFIAKLPHANRGATGKKRHFRALFHPLSVTNFCTINIDRIEQNARRPHLDLQGEGVIMICNGDVSLT